MIANPATRPARRGTTIIEVLVAVTGVTLLIGMCAVTIQLLFRVNAASQDRLNSAMVDDRISRQLRDDVHRSERAEILAPPAGRVAPPGLRLTLADELVITYTVGEKSIARDESRAGKMIRHESYLLPRDRVARFLERDRDSVRFVALEITQIPGKSRTDPPRPLEILALPGKLGTLAAIPKGGQP